MKIRLDDTVLIIAGKDRSKKGRVTRLSSKTNRIVVENVNIRTKHIKKKPGQVGQRIAYEAAIDASNAMVICPHCSKPTRISYLIIKEETGHKRKQRLCKKCGQSVDRPIQRRKTKKKL